MFTIERFFKDNEHYNDYFGIFGNAFVDSLAIFWTDKVYFESKLETLSDIVNLPFYGPEDSLQSEVEPIIIEIDYNLKRQKVTLPDYMNCLISFISAVNSKHPSETINDYILKNNPQIKNAKNKVVYCDTEDTHYVRFDLMSFNFIETVLFGAYFYWDCLYDTKERSIYQQYADYYLDELAEFTGIDREYVREHHLFKVYDEMKRIFRKSFIKALNESSNRTEEYSKVDTAKQDTNIDPLTEAFYEIAKLDYVNSKGETEKYIKYKYEWYYVMRAAVELKIVTEITAFTEFVGLLPNDICNRPNKAILSDESAKFGNKREHLLSELNTCKKRQEMKQVRFDKGLKIAEKFSQLYNDYLKKT